MDVQLTSIDLIGQALADENNDEKPRAYLGMSAIGHSCDHKLWYDFRWASPKAFDAVTCRRFSDGHRVEAELIRQLKMTTVGFRGFTPEGEQIEVETYAGHMRGHLDGLIWNMPDREGKHVWECKAVAESSFNKLSKLVAQDESQALSLWNQTYYAQAQLYMYFTKITKHVTFVATPGARKVQQVFTAFDACEADRYISRGGEIITATSVGGLEKISATPNWYECKYCEHAKVCHEAAPMEKNCRTCRYSTPDLGNGTWRCTLYDEALTYQQQMNGCDKHKEVQYEFTNTNTNDGW